nr:protein HOMOLOG OF MAMMALIAN LYST-INTERACTING PROTEIN 5-like [Physcomitrium patens]|eukprot:XP_024391523.1 protein HOMOLOG OF MAMMALIAN LYST-INTERACTING PROTEIN 5-like [Physcomitrella patens]
MTEERHLLLLLEESESSLVYFQTRIRVLLGLGLGQLSPVPPRLYCEQRNSHTDTDTERARERGAERPREQGWNLCLGLVGVGRRRRRRETLRAMTIDGEPAKVLLPYLQRADELQKHDHLAAYYCRLYAMEKGLKIPPKERTSETKAVLISLMNQLEKDKRVVKLSTDDNMYMEGFALRVFAKADKQDRAGRADLKTAMTFYAASIFFEVLLQFGELPPDILEKQKYASWKAVDIRKALSEGRKPVPGPPVPDKDAPEEEYTTWSTEANNINAPETQQPKSSSNRDSFLGSSDPNTVPHRSYTQLPPSELPLQPSHSSCPEDLPSAPSNSTLSSYNQNSQSSADNPGYPSNSPSHQSLYSHTSGVSFDPSSGNDRMPGHHVVGTYSYPSDSPGFSSSPPPSHNSYPSAPQDMQGGPNPTHFYQPSHWPNPSANDSASAYPSFFPPAGSGFQLSTPQYPTTPQAPQGVLRHSEPPPLARTGSAPVGPDSSTGYSLNGNYNSDFKPSAGAVAEAHKASRFAVSALAFDDIPTAISYLTKSLELLTSPSVSI